MAIDVQLPPVEPVAIDVQINILALRPARF